MTRASKLYRYPASLDLMRPRLVEGLGSAPSPRERANWVVVAEGDGPPVLEVPRVVSTKYLTHGLVRYAGKLPPPLVAYLLDQHSQPGDRILDPMCGGGTTAIEAVTAGRPSLNFDINPVCCLLTEALSSSANLDSLISFANQIVEEASPRQPPTALADFFSPTAYGLLSLMLERAWEKSQIALALSIARRASFANTKKINTVVDTAKIPKEPKDLLMESLQRFLSGYDALNEALSADSRVGRASATNLPVAEDEVDLVLLHPPYLTNTAFSEATHLQLLLLGEEPKKLRHTELAFRGSYFHVPNGLKKYILNWARVLKEAMRVLKPGGCLAVVIGDGHIDGIRIPVAALTVELAKDIGFHLLEHATHLLNNQTGWTLSRRMTEQHVLVFRR